jgi:hypothetical protein
MMSKAREARFRRLIKALANADDALSAVIAHEPIGEADDSRIRLRRDIAEYADYLDRATWWKAGAR